VGFQKGALFEKGGNHWNNEWINIVDACVSGGKMGRLENALYIIQGEVNLLVTAMRRNNRWMSPNIHQVV